MRAMPEGYFEDNAITDAHNAETAALLNAIGATIPDALKSAWAEYQGEIEHGMMPEYADHDEQMIREDFALFLKNR